MHINPNIEKPIFIQIAEQLEDSIFTKVFPEETKIPSTNELSDVYKRQTRQHRKNMCNDFFDKTVSRKVKTEVRELYNDCLLYTSSYASDLPEPAEKSILIASDNV